MTGAAEIYIEGSPAERRAGHLDANGLALGLDIERVTRPRLIGAIFLARVKAVDKRLGAAFLDLGAAGIGLLSKAKDITEGEAVLVQITRDAHDDKGPAAVRQPVLWGRYLGLQPGRGGGLQCARALGQGKHRAEALAAAESGIADPTDLILRGPSWTVSGAELKAEADRLRATWADIQARAKTEKAPALLLPTTPFIETMLRDAGPEARVALDDRLDFATAEKLCAEYFPDLSEGLDPPPEPPCLRRNRTPDYPAPPQWSDRDRFRGPDRAWQDEDIPGYPAQSVEECGDAQRCSGNITLGPGRNHPPAYGTQPGRSMSIAGGLSPSGPRCTGSRCLAPGVAVARGRKAGCCPAGLSGCRAEWQYEGGTGSV